MLYTNQILALSLRHLHIFVSWRCQRIRNVPLCHWNSYFRRQWTQRIIPMVSSTGH